jgi:hypothetical protein
MAASFYDSASEFPRELKKPMSNIGETLDKAFQARVGMLPCPSFQNDGRHRHRRERDFPVHVHRDWRDRLAFKAVPLVEVVRVQKKRSGVGEFHAFYDEP